MCSARTPADACAGPCLTPGLADAGRGGELVVVGRRHCVAGSVPIRVASDSASGAEGTGLVPAIIAVKSPMLCGRKCSSTLSAAPTAAANVSDTLHFAAIAIGTSGSFLTRAAAGGGLLPVRH